MPLTAALQSLSAFDPIEAAARPRKGAVTRGAILDLALRIARREGLEGLTIGALAAESGMSKSGVFAHFGSREELQLAVLQAYAQRFVGEVLRPAIREQRGLPRLRRLLDGWVELLVREIEHGCLMIAGASEYDDRPGPLRDAMVAIVVAWKGELLRSIEQAKEQGEIDPGADADQLVFEIYGLMLVLHQDARLLRSSDSALRARKGLARLLDSCRVSAPPDKAGAASQADAVPTDAPLRAQSAKSTTVLADLSTELPGSAAPRRGPVGSRSR